jgi:single-strand DNA-binding protein
MNDIQVVLRGNIASDLRSVRFDDGNSVTSFRLASTSSWFDRERNTWVDRRTTYVSVNCRRALANNALQSLHKGHPVVITGRLWERAWVKEERSGRTLEVEAETVGHDLTFGVSAFTRVVRSGRDRHAGEDGSTVEERDREERSADEAAVFEAVREIAAPVTDVSGFQVLEDEPDALDADDDEEASGGKVSATRAG